MHGFVTEKLHGILDYFTVILFLSSPALFNLSDGAAALAYALGAVHLLLSLATRFSYGMFSTVPFKLHGVIEIIVSVALIVASLAVFTGDEAVYYFAVGIIIFMVWLLSDYTQPKNSKADSK